MRFEHSGKFTRIAYTTGTAGEKVAGASATVYDGEVDVQTESRANEVASGIQVSRGSARVFFPVSVLEIALQPDDTCVLNLTASISYSGRVDRVDHVDDSCVVLYD